MKIRLDDFEVVGNGSIIGSIGRPIYFSFEGDDFILKISFENTDSAQDIRRIGASAFGSNGVHIIFYNHNISQIGSKKPIKIKGLKNADLYMEYAISNVTDENKIFYYTFHIRNKED